MSRLKAVMNRYETLVLEMEWADENDAPIDITGREFEIIESFPAMVGTFEIIDGPAGKVHLTIQNTSAFELGETNWVRVSMALPDAGLDTTPPIWINVL